MESGKQVKSAFHAAGRTGMFPDVFTYGLAVNRLGAGSNPARGATCNFAH
jgi:hypothetical protein